jgi:sporadic carbohydrate cluster protein (TIGR04323 family)
MNIQILNNKIFRGYISSRDINGSFYPQNIQNLIIRTFCKEKKINLQLSGTEWNVKDSFLMLRSVIVEKNNGIIFFSIYQILENLEMFKILTNKILNKKKVMIFCLENISISNKKELNNIINSIKVNKSIGKMKLKYK